MMIQVSDLGTSCEIGGVPVPISNDDQNSTELGRKKKPRTNNPETEADFSSGHSCLVSHVTASNLPTDALFLPQSFTSSDGLKRKCCKNYSPRQIISSYSSSEKQFMKFTLAPVDGRHCRLRLPMQFTEENGINKPGKIYLLGIDGSKWLANLLMESRGRMTLGDGWKSFVKANGLKTGESFTLKLNWEDTTPVLSLCPTEYNIDRGTGGGYSKASEKESLPIEPSSRKEITKVDNNIDDNSKGESSSWEREKNHLSSRASTTPSQNRFLTLTITPDSLKHGRQRLPLQFMRENSMNIPGEITLLGKDGAKWLASLLLEKRGRMSLGKGWKDFAKANDLMTGDSITLEAIWEDATPMLSLFNTESSSARRQQGESSKASEKESLLTEPSSELKTKKAENNREEISIYLSIRRDSSSAIQNQFVTATLSPEIVRPSSHDVQNGEVVVFRHKEDMMFQVSELRPSCCEIRDVAAPNRNNDQDNIGSSSMQKDADPRKEACFSSKDGEFQDNMELPRKKKVKKNNPETEADSSSAQFCFVSHVTASNLCADALYLPQDLTCSNSLKRKYRKDDSPGRIISSYSSSEGQFVTFTLAPVDVRHCRLRLPMQFTRENGINKPGKIYLLGIDGSKWLANLLLESRGRMTVGDGWKSFVKANRLTIGESYTLKLNNWEDTTPVLSLCPAEYNIDRKAGGGYSEASEKEFLSLEPSSEKEMSKDDNNNNKEENSKDEDSKEESSSWERDKNHLSWRASTSPNQNRFLTLTINPDSLKHGRQRIPLQFMRDNSMTKPGEITLLGKDGAKWLASLLLEKRGRMCLGKGWKDFAIANGLKTGDSITLESIWEDTTPVLSLLRIVSSNDRGQSDISKEYHSTELSSENKTRKAENNREESSSGELEKRKHLPRKRDSFSAIQKRFVILPEDVRDGELHLPSQFMRDNGINKLGKITLLGKNGMKWLAYLLSRDGTVALGNGWKGFCEANGVKVRRVFHS